MSLLCFSARETSEEDGPVVNPRPAWAWPAREGAVTEVANVLGVKYSSPSYLALEVDRLRWYGDAKRSEKRGWLELRRCDVHADVSRIHGLETPFLELCYEEPGASKHRRALKLRFESLEDMSAWWSDLSRAQQLLAQVDTEEGRKPHRFGDEEEDDDASMAEDDLEAAAAAALCDPAVSPRRRAKNECHVDLTRGLFEPSLFLSIRRAYEQVLGMIIRPPRAKYGVHQLGPPCFAYGSVPVPPGVAPPRGGEGATVARAPPHVRDDFFVVNGRGLRVASSLWRPQGYSEVTNAALGPRASRALYDEAMPLAKSPTLIYLHGNASCRVEACTTLSLAAGLGLSVCAIDCAGSGHSDGEYISLGLYEADDVVAVVDHLKREYGLSKYALWGRSMGSVTALLYASGKAPDCSCVVADSPFVSIKQLCYDLVHKAAPSIPDSAVAIAVRKVRKSVKYRTKFDILKCNPAKKVAACAAPLLLVHGRDDDFIRPSHTDAIAKTYGGKHPVTVLKPMGGHNSRRSYDTYRTIEKFLATHLLGDANAHRRVDFFQVKGIPDRVENPYLFPPWAYATTKDGAKTALAVPPKAQPKGRRQSANGAKQRNGNSEFVSGMSESRQAEVEAGIGTLFGAKAKKQ